MDFYKNDCPLWKHMCSKIASLNIKSSEPILDSYNLQVLYTYDNQDFSLTFNPTQLVRNLPYNRTDKF